MSETPHIKPADPVVDNGVVEMLLALVEQARKGELLAIAGIGLCSGGESSRFMSASIGLEPIRALGMLRVLAMSIEARVDLSDTDSVDFRHD